MTKYKILSKLILKKSDSFLRLSLIAFVTLLIITVTTTILLINQYIQMEKDFIKNENSHIIEVSSQWINNQILRFNSISKDEISKLITKNYPAVKYFIINKYDISGILTKNNNSYYSILSLDDSASKAIKDFNLKDNTIYIPGIKNSSNLTLLIPKITLVKGNSLSSDEIIEYNVNVEQINYENNPFIPNDPGPSIQALVNLKTYKKIINIMNSPKEYISKIFVYVENLEDVEPIAKLLYQNKYNTNYLFEAFDNFVDSIDSTTKMFSILIVMILIGTIINIILAFNSYLKVQQKDMGILKQIGLDNKNIRKIYSKSINDIWLKITVFIEIYILVFCEIFLKQHFLRFSLAIIGTSLSVLFIVNLIIVEIILRKYIKKDILTLLKTSKEFE